MLIAERQIADKPEVEEAAVIVVLRVVLVDVEVPLAKQAKVHGAREQQQEKRTTKGREEKRKEEYRRKAGRNCW